MSKPIIREHNIETGEFVDREMTDAEFEQYNKDQAESEAKINEELAQSTAKIELLAKLGITEDEAKLLLS